MKRKWIALVLSVSVLAGTAAVPAFASEMQQEISEMPAVETLQDHTLAETDSVEENCVLVGLKGSYLASADAALKRINEIRKEACKQGIQDPRDPNRKLTMSDYVPVKWSSDLEYIARVRAAEASVYMDHQRPNGTMCFSQASPNGVESWGEVLAWNNSNDMITGIDQWYGEKQDWVKQTGGVTGHYTSMINPNNLYVGLATFICPDADFKNTTSGEFSFETGLDEGQAKAVKNKVQKIQVQNQDVKAYMEPFKEKLASSKTVQAKFYANYRGSGFYQSRTHKLSFEDTVEWSSSNPKVAAVDEKGVVTGVSAGTAKITAKCGIFEESRTIQVTGDAKVQVKKITGVPKKKTLKKGNAGGGRVGQHGRAEIVDRVIEGIRRVDIGLADIQMIDLLAGCRCCHCVRMEFTHGGLAACKCFAGQLHMNTSCTRISRDVHPVLCIKFRTKISFIIPQGSPKNQ